MPRYAVGVNDILPTFRAMTRRIAFLVFPRFQILDATGPLAAFEIAERYRPGSYTLRTIATAPGAVASSSGACLQASPLGPAKAVDTLIVAGGEGSREAAVCSRTLRFVLDCARRSRRVASVCSGTYVLAAAGLLDGRSATTHWSVTADFSRRFPQVRLDADRIYVRDGKIWSSAGITAGIDLALALIGEDLGEDIARRTAQQLVVYHRRPGGQSQFSPLLQMERADEAFRQTMGSRQDASQRPARHRGARALELHEPSQLLTRVQGGGRHRARQSGRAAACRHRTRRPGERQPYHPTGGRGVRVRRSGADATQLPARPGRAALRSQATRAARLISRSATGPAAAGHVPTARPTHPVVRHPAKPGARSGPVSGSPDVAARSPTPEAAHPPK